MKLISIQQLFTRFGIIILLSFGVIAIVTIAIFTTVKPPAQPTTPRESPIKTYQLPKTPAGGVDENAKIVQTSQQMISQLQEKLPFVKEKFITSSGHTTSYRIFRLETDPDFVININVYGINFQSVSGDPDYNQNVQDFQETARGAFDWIKSQGVNPNDLIILWGDRKFIQDSAESWLK
ncbi:hypothetical protein HY388_01445 [Candidatus Daviesbacteria bacterium]|nr:hypothetical protein [Candidatus Daviesbacteria bacterium]